METILDGVQLAIDVVGMFPGCNVICGAVNAVLLGSQDFLELCHRIKNQEFQLTDQEDLALLVSLGQNGQIALQSGKDACEEVKPKKQAPNAGTDKEQSKEDRKKRETDFKKAEGAKQKKEDG